MNATVRPLAVFFKALALFVLVNVLYGLVQPRVADVYAYNRFIPGLERMPFGVSTDPYTLTVDNADAMGGMQGIRDVLHQLDLVDQGQLRADRQDRLPIDKLHGDVRLASNLIDLVHLADVVVRDACLRARFVQKALRHLRVGQADKL